MPDVKQFLKFNPKKAVLPVVVVLFLLGIVQIAQGFIDTRNYRAEITQIIKDQTGRDIIIQGKVTVSLLPLPTIYLPGVELRDAQGSETPAPSISVDMVRVRVPLLSLLSHREDISEIIFERPTLELVRAKDNYIHWEWLNAALLKTFVQKHDASIRMQVIDGKISYYDKRTDQGTTADKVNISISGGQQLSIASTLQWKDRPLSLNVELNSGKKTPDGLSLVNIHAVSGNDQFTLQGGMDLSAELPKIKGKLNLNVANVDGWLGSNSASSTPASLQLNGQWEQDGLSIALSDVDVEGLGASGGGKLGLVWDDWRPSYSADLHFIAVNYNTLRALFDPIIRKAVTPPSTAESGDVVNTNPIPADIRVSAKFTADKVLVDQKPWENVLLAADITDGTITVNQFSTDLPGKSSLTLFGIIAQGAATPGLRFEGNMEMHGPSLREFLTIVDPSASSLPDVGFGEFSGKSNLFISPQQLRLSEADVKMSDLRLTGGLVAYYDEQPRVEADVRLKDINFDYFRDVWRGKQEIKGTHDSFLNFDQGLRFDWLKKLETNIDLRINVDGFKFLERQGNNSSFRIYVKQGEFGVYDMRFNYPDQTTTEASFNLNVMGEHPMVNVMLNTDRLDTAYFGVAPISDVPPPPVLKDAKPLEIIPQAETVTVPAEPQANTTTATEDNEPAPVIPESDMSDAYKTWSANLINMGWMDGFNGTFDISIGSLKHRTITVDRLKVLAKLDNNMLTFQNFTFMYWQGRCGIAGYVFGGKVPGVSLSFTLFNAELYDIFKELTGRENITGKASISGTLTTSGINYQSWVSQSNAKIVLAARGVDVKGINLQSVIDAVAVSRTAADVLNNANLALVKGNTVFDIDGNINVRGGVMKTPGITLKSGTVTGNMTGEVKLVPWTMESSTLFQFPSISSETIPTMTVQLSGAVDAPVLRTDTSSLEAFVAKRIISQ